MDIVFEVNDSKYTNEIGFFDTVLELKEALQTKHGFPLARQTLVYNNEVLKDEYNIQHYEILEGCHIRVLLEPPERIKVMVNWPDRRYPFEIDASDTIAFLKENIRKVNNVPTNRLSLMHAGTELENHRRLGDYSVSEQFEINVVIKPTLRRNAKMMRVFVETTSGERIPLDVKPSNTVQDVKMKLEDKGIAPNEHFFVYRQDIMTDNRTLHWHNVKDGHTLWVFKGTVTCTD